jgi:hypothetical protein
VLLRADILAGAVGPVKRFAAAPTAMRQGNV